MDVAHCYLEGNADAVEFCPHEPNRHVLAASTYTLQEEGGGDGPTRSGSISLFCVDHETRRLELSHRVKTAGVFDIKWSPPRSSSGPLLAQADADGFLRIHRLCSGSDETEELSLEEITGKKIGSSSMCLYLDWNPSATSIAVGLSDGSAAIASLAESRLESGREWKAHDFEVWTAAFDPHRSHLVFTGSDDCKFSGWDLRCGGGNDEDGPAGKAFQNTRAHKMGVCCIAPSPHEPNVVLTGSYDESLRVWDLRSVSRPIEEAELRLGGGVWRIKHHPFVPGLVLAACMHNGFAVARIGAGAEAGVVERYDKHESLAYGADWHRGEPVNDDGKKMSSLVATCSFYDKLLKVWIPQIDLAM